MHWNVSVRFFFGVNRPVIFDFEFVALSEIRKIDWIESNQGMSDMASPILFVMASESHAYIAFCALMERLKDNFTTTGAAMTLKFEHLTAALQYYDPEFFAYLERHNVISNHNNL